jgi:hypothetical protein
MIISNYNIKLRTYTLRRIFNGKTIAKYRTKPIHFKERKKLDFYGSQSWNKYIKDNNLQNIKK